LLILSKFPDEKYPEFPFIPTDERIPYNPDIGKRLQVGEIIKRLNKNSAGGIVGLKNKLLLWIYQNYPIRFVDMIIQFIEKAAYHGYPKILSMLLTHGREITFGKPKNGKFDYDLRPIKIAFSILRLSDKVYFVLLINKRELLVGPYQIIGK
jgi:hypothetical protein